MAPAPPRIYIGGAKFRRCFSAERNSAGRSEKGFESREIPPRWRSEILNKVMKYLKIYAERNYTLLPETYPLVLSVEQMCGLLPFDGIRAFRVSESGPVELPDGGGVEYTRTVEYLRGAGTAEECVVCRCAERVLHRRGRATAAYTVSRPSSYDQEVRVCVSLAELADYLNED